MNKRILLDALEWGLILLIGILCFMNCVINTYLCCYS